MPQNSHIAQAKGTPQRSSIGRGKRHMAINTVPSDGHCYVRRRACLTLVHTGRGPQWRETTPVLAPTLPLEKAWHLV